MSKCTSSRSLKPSLEFFWTTIPSTPQTTSCLSWSRCRKLMSTNLSWTFSVLRILSPTKSLSRPSSTKYLVNAVMHSLISRWFLLFSRGPKLDQQTTPGCIKFWKRFARLVQNKKDRFQFSSTLDRFRQTSDSGSSLLTEGAWAVGVTLSLPLTLFRNVFFANNIVR